MKIQYFVISILVYEVGYNKMLDKKDIILYVTVAISLALFEFKRYQLQVLLLPFVVILMLLLQNRRIQWRPIEVLRWFFGTKLLHRASDSSYAVYLFHGFFLSLSGLLLAQNQILMTLHPLMRIFTMWIFVVICSYSFAYLIFKYVEGPGIKIGKALITKFSHLKDKKS